MWAGSPALAEKSIGGGAKGDAGGLGKSSAREWRGPESEEQASRGVGVETLRKPPKRHTPSGSVGLEPPVCADSSMTRPRSPAAPLASPSSKFHTRATNTSHGLGWGAGGRLLETEVKLEFVDIEERAVSGHRKIRSSVSPKGSERDLPLPRKRPYPLPSSSSVPLPGQVFLEEQEEGTLGLHVYSEKRKACSLGSPDLHAAASHTKCLASPGRNKPKGDSGLYSLKSVLGPEPPGQPEKKVSKQKARGQREEGELTLKKSRDPVLSSGQSPLTPAPVQAASPDRSKVGQPIESEKVKQADVLIAHLAREVRRLKKWKKRHLLAAVGETSSLVSLQKPPCLKKLVRTLKAETKGWAFPRHSSGALDAVGPKPASDIRQLFTTDCKNVCPVPCTLCHASVRHGQLKGHFQASGLVHHLVSKHGLERERRPTAASPGEKRGGTGDKKHKGLPASATSLAPEGLPSPGRCPDASPEQLSSSGSLLLGQKERSLLEQLESVGLLASKRSGASLSTESHLASIIVKKYLRENETIGAQEDPLVYWEKRQEVWPALARLATVYLSCPPTGAFSGSVCASLDSPAFVQPSAPLPVETVERLLFLKTNLENFPNYIAPPLLFPRGDLAEGEQTSKVDLRLTP
ncbi:hypothetical protein GH733_013626 [Mirounga leonina]|nr:hypothetical protein GH733_013626 [Mirounga leonina]